MKVNRDVFFARFPKGEKGMDADKILCQADFSLETDLKQRLRRELAAEVPVREGETVDDLMEDVAAAKAEKSCRRASRLVLAKISY